MSHRRKHNLLVPIALTATAAAASFALWYFLHDDNDTHNNRRTLDGHESDYEPSRRGGRSSPTTATTATKTNIAAVDRAIAGGSSAAAATGSGGKKSVALVLREGSEPSKLLQHLPTPFPLDRVNVFVLIYSPGVTAHPLSDSDAATFEVGKEEGKVYRQSRKFFPAEAPRELVMPYTEVESLVPMLKQLAPETVYIEGELAGMEGEVVAGVMEGGWVGGVVVTVWERGMGQKLADATGRWGKRVRVMDVDKVGDDWMARIR
jgi:hypothetical protein